MTLFIGIGQHLDHSIFYNKAASAKPKKKNNNKKKSKKKAEEEEEGEDGAPIARLDKGQAVTAVPSPGAFNDSSYATVVAAFDSAAACLDATRADASSPSHSSTLVRKTPLFAPYIYKMYQFTKTGSGQT